MTRSQDLKRLTKNSALYVGVAMAVILAIPALAAVVYGVRLLIPFLLVAGVLAAVISPAFRRRLVGEGEAQAQRHGLAVPPRGLSLHPAHAWARLDGKGGACVGVDALALAALGRVTAVEPVAVGARVDQGQPLCTLFHGKRQLRVLAPVRGEIVAMNPAVLADPATVSGNPYGGWLIELQGVASGPDSLTEGSAITAWFGREVDRFVAALGSPAAAASMADGGVLHTDLSSAIDDETWEAIRKAFFA